MATRPTGVEDTSCLIKVSDLYQVISHKEISYSAFTYRLSKIFDVIKIKTLCEVTKRLINILYITKDDAGKIKQSQLFFKKRFKVVKTWPK